MCIVKKISVFCMLISFGVAYPMKRALELDDKNQRIVTFKSLKGFPLTSLSKGAVWFSSLSERDKGKVTTNIINHNDDRLKLLFNVVTRLPEDIKKLITAHLFEEDKKITNLSNSEVFAEYKNVANMFCTKPLYDVFNQYALSTQIFQKPNEFNIRREIPLQQHIIFEYANGIKVFREMNCSDNNCSKKDLECISKVVDRFPFLASRTTNKQFLYQYKSLTINNFKKQFNKDQFFLLLACVASYVLLTFPDGCNYVFNQPSFEFNQAAREFNVKIDSLYCKTRHKPFSESRIRLLNEYDCVKNAFGYYKVSAIVVMGLLSFYCGYRSICLIPREIDSRHIWPLCKIFVGAMITTRLPSMLSYISSQLSEGLPEDIGYLVIFYGVMCFSYNMYKTSCLQEGGVWLNAIPRLLQRRDICIV